MRSWSWLFSALIAVISGIAAVFGLIGRVNSETMTIAGGIAAIVGVLITVFAFVIARRR